MFEYNKDKQPLKRKTESREKARTKRQLCEGAIHHQELVESFDFECNTKETQTDVQTTPLKVDIRIQCNILPHNNQEQKIPLSEEGQEEEEGQDDTNDDYEEENIAVPEFHDETQPATPSKAAFIVYWASLVILLKRCLFPACFLTTVITNVAYKGSQLVVTMKCPDEHQITWKSQPDYNHYSIGNLTSAASVLFSANTFKRIADFFDKFLCKNYNKTTKEIYNDMKKHSVYDLSGDGRCDSPGHN